MNNEEFIKFVGDLGLTLDNSLLASLDAYYKLLILWNEKFNLTAITQKNDVYLKHFYDSLCIVKTNLIKNEKQKLCDFGTGAGLPGIVIKIFFPNISVTLIESNSKKCEFLKEVIDTLKLNDIEVINERIEIYAKKNRELFDIVTCRAVSSLKIISELAIPTLKVGGFFVPLKANIDEEIESSKEILNKLNSIIENVVSYNLPKDNSVRNIPVIKKIGKTAELYPREYSKIKKENC